MFIEQGRRFGPLINDFEEIADAERLAIDTSAIIRRQKNQKWLSFLLMSEHDKLARPNKDSIAVRKRDECDVEHGSLERKTS